MNSVQVQYGKESFDAHNVPKGYRRTEVGVIPEDWDVINLGNKFEITSSKRVFQSEWKTEGIPFYRARELAGLSETGQVDNELFISKEMYETYKRLYGVPKVNDILITGVGTLGKVLVITDENEFYFKDGNIIWLKNSGQINPQFVKQLFLTPVIIRQIEEGAAGTTVGTYTITGAKKTITPYPSLPEQHAIAEALSDVDGLLAALDRLIEKKRAIKQAAMQQLLTGKTRLPGFSGEWERKRLGEVGDCLRGVSYDPDRDLASSDMDNTIRLLRANNIKEGIINTTNVQYVQSRRVDDWQIMQYQDILICTANGSKELVGKAGQFTISDGYKYTFGAFMGCFRTDRSIARSKFVFYLFQTNKFRDFIRIILAGSSINNLTPDNIEKHEIMMPDMDEQAAIAATLSEMDDELVVLDLRWHKVRQIKQGMMEELLTGRIRLVEPQEMEANA